MLKMVVFKTNRPEAELFLRLTALGRHAEIPYYQSVESYNVKDGTVTFARLDCAPVQPYKVGCSGDCVVTTLTFSSRVGAWLVLWGITFQQEMQECDSPAEARQILTDMRNRVDKEERARINLAIEEGIKAQQTSLDAELLRE